MSHQHRCPCGAVLTCPQEPDHCAVVSAVFQCPTCELASFDDYLTRIANARIIARQPAPAPKERLT